MERVLILVLQVQQVIQVLVETVLPAVKMVAAEVADALLAKLVQHQQLVMVVPEKIFNLFLIPDFLHAEHTLVVAEVDHFVRKQLEEPLQPEAVAQDLLIVEILEELQELLILAVVVALEVLVRHILLELLAVELVDQV